MPALLDRTYRRVLAALLAGCILPIAPTAAQPAPADAPADAPRAMTLVDLLSLPGVEEPRLSPDGDRIAFVKETADWDRNRRIEHIWITPQDGNESFQLTNGDAFMRDMVGHYFNEAHRDVMAGVDYLIDEGLVDGERMAKMGWSAGGHMTNKIITYTDRFKAAASGAGAANWISMYSQSDVRIYRTPWFEGNPWEENAPIDTFWQNSPLAEVAAVSTPTIFLVGQKDNRVPMPQSVEMYRGVKTNGVPTHLYVAPRAAHGWSELRHRLFKANVEIAWFERWVRERAYDWVKAPGDTDEETAIPDWVPTASP